MCEAFFVLRLVTFGIVFKFKVLGLLNVVSYSKEKWVLVVFYNLYVIWFKSLDLSINKKKTSKTA